MLPTFLSAPREIGDRGAERKDFSNVLWICVLWIFDGMEKKKEKKNEKKKKEKKKKKREK